MVVKGALVCTSINQSSLLLLLVAVEDANGCKESSCFLNLQLNFWCNRCHEACIEQKSVSYMVTHVCLSGEVLNVY